MAKKVCFLGMPSHGGVTFHAAAGYWAARCDPETVHRSHQGSSLLDSNCTALWGHALNTHRRGKRLAYFALLHSDVQPEPFWLDLLVQELEATGLDLLSAVVPIKDGNGRTSTAVGDIGPDAFGCGYRLTMREVHRLPETFTAADLGLAAGKCLLLNTGCFVCRLDESWAKDVWFDGRTRMRFDPERDAYVTEADPEDWRFTRALQRLGLKAGATRKVTLTHRGPRDHGNAEPWGDDEFDSEYLSAPAFTPANGPPDWRFPRDVEGWLTEAEGRALADLARGKEVLEIGSYCGRSTICMAQTAESVSAVDPFDGRGTPHPKGTYELFRANLKRYGVSAATIIGTASELLHPKMEAVCDLVFIDGAHDYDSVRADIRVAEHVLRPGGLIAFHDYRTAPGEADGRWDPGVTQAVDELLGRGARLLSRHDSLAVVAPAPALMEVPC